jgi:exopolysaccharide biosynthesis polyprenyl glycosylphosphotransferase
LKHSKDLQKRHLYKYYALDAFSGAFAYTVLHIVRKIYVEPVRFGLVPQIRWDLRFWEGLLFTTFVFVTISALSGIYRDVLRKSRLAEFIRSIGSGFLTSILLFFTLFLDDYIKDYNQYYLIFAVYSLSLISVSSFGRFVLSSIIRRKLDNRTLGFPTIIVGSGKEASELLKSFKKNRNKGYEFLGYLGNKECHQGLQELNFLGGFDQLQDLIRDNNVEDVILALSTTENEHINKIISSIENESIRIHLLPNLINILSGQVKMESLGRSLVEIKRELVLPHVAVFKRVFDIVISLILIVLTSPILLFSMLMISVGSNGPIFYKQSRLGKRGRSFQILKLRSMYNDAESAGPQLSSEEDPRITPWGRTMRKYRFDELPQFINVLKGDMSIVGPRPERKYYFDQILEREPQYRHLLRVKPGITSWGMVKFGYAENVEEMIERARFDLIYTENITIVNDIKILFYTLVIVLQGRGK